MIKSSEFSFPFDPMQRVLATVAVAAILAAFPLHARAQDPCATLGARAPAFAGFAGAKTDTMKSGNNVICEAYAPDRKSKLGLIVEPPQAASGLAMRKMLAANSKEPGLKVKDEPTLGANAFSFATKQQVVMNAAGKGGVYVLSLNRDAGVAPGDEDALRALAKQLVDGR